MFREIEVCDSIVSVAESITPAKSNFDFEKGKTKMIGEIKKSPYSKWLKGKIESDEGTRSITKYEGHCL